MRASGARFLLGSTVLALVFAGLACGDDDPAPTGAPPATGGAAGTAGTAGTAGVGGTAGTAGAPGVTPPGSFCACDSECLGTPGHPGICLLGMCMQQATAECPSRGVQDGCPAGSLCFNTEMLPGVGVCWPEADQVTCAGVENRHGVCSPIRGTQCDTSCGVACEATQPAFGKPGGSCLPEGACDLPGDAMCYEDEDFPGNYCLQFGCQFDFACGTEAACFPLASDGSGVCMDLCGMDFDCREGYVCAKSDTHTSAYCIAGCDEAATCPTGYVCVGNGCMPEAVACTPQNPTGRCPGDDRCENGECVPKNPPCSALAPYGVCPDGEYCNSGVCGPFTCNDTILEPNDTLQTAATMTAGDTMGYQICAGDHDWYQVTPDQANTLYLVGVDSNYDLGNIDFDMTDASGAIISDSEITPDSYHDENPVGPMDLQAHSVMGAPGSTPVLFHTHGHAASVTNNYGTVLRAIPWQDGPNCAALFTPQECISSSLIVFPMGNPADPYAGDAVFFANALTTNGATMQHTSGMWARRELIMIIRHAIHSVQEAFPGTAPLGIGEVSMPDGTTPWGHPNGTHYSGANIDISYYIRPDAHRAYGNMAYRQICCDAALLSDWTCVDRVNGSPEWGTCVAGSESTHIVDIPRTAMMIAKIAGSGRLRVIGVEAKVEADIDAELANQVSQGLITSTERASAMGRMATANDDSSWVWHFNHMHASFLTAAPTATSVNLRSAPTFQGPWPDLPKAEQEVRIRDFYKTRSHLAKPATQ